MARLFHRILGGRMLEIGLCHWDNRHFAQEMVSHILFWSKSIIRKKDVWKFSPRQVVERMNSWLMFSDYERISKVWNSRGETIKTEQGLESGSFREPLQNCKWLRIEIIHQGSWNERVDFSYCVEEWHLHNVWRSCCLRQPRPGARQQSLEIRHSRYSCMDAEKCSSWHSEIAAKCWRIYKQLKRSDVPKII